MLLKMITLLLVLFTVVCAHNRIVMTMLVHDSDTSQRRFKHFQDQIQQFGFAFDYVNASSVKMNENRKRSINIGYLALLDRFQNSGFASGILCEDDTQFHPHFIAELNQTETAAGDFTVLGLCNLFMWTRHHSYSGIYAYAVTQSIKNYLTDPTGRIFTQWPQLSQPYPLHGTYVWPGTPVCILIKNEPSVITKLQHGILTQINEPIDIILRNVMLMDPRMKLVAEPQLCSENEQGSRVTPYW